MIAAVAQSVEQRTENPCVASSILACGIFIRLKISPKVSIILLDSLLVRAIFYQALQKVED